MKIREYANEDWFRICIIHDLARPLELIGSCDARAFVPILEDPDVEHLKSCRKHVICTNSQVVGFSGVDGDNFAWLYVDPKYSGQGAGRNLLQHALPLIGPNGWCIVLEGNVRARQLYEGAGFKTESRFKSSNAGFPCACLRMTLGPA